MGGKIELKTLPLHLQKSIDGFVKAKEDGDDLLASCWWGEIYGSINSAETDREISPELAWELREKYLGMDRDYNFLEDHQSKNDK